MPLKKQTGERTTTPRSLRAERATPVPPERARSTNVSAERGRGGARVGRCCRERQTSGASSQSRRERGVRRAAPAEGLRAGYERSRRAMGKRLDGLGRGSATPRGGRRCAAGSPPVLVAVGATLGGGEGSKVVLSTRNERGPGYQHPCPAREGARRGVCARSQKKKKKRKDKKGWWPGASRAFISKLFLQSLD